MVDEDVLKRRRFIHTKISSDFYTVVDFKFPLSLFKIIRSSTERALL